MSHPATPRPRRGAPAALLLALAALTAGAGLAQEEETSEPPRGRRVTVELRDEGDRPRVLVLGEDGLVPVGMPSARRGYLGVGLVDLTPELRAHFGAPEEAGVLISRVEPDSPAQRAGIEVGDVLVAVGGERVGSSGQAARRIGLGEQGAEVDLEVVRGGGSLTVTAALGEHQRARLDVGELLWCDEGEECEEGLAFRHVFPIDPEQLNDAMARLNEHLASPEWRERVLRFKGGYEGLESRIQELEEKIRELEAQLREQSE